MKNENTQKATEAYTEHSEKQTQQLSETQATDFDEDVTLGAVDLYIIGRKGTASLQSEDMVMDVNHYGVHGVTRWYQFRRHHQCGQSSLLDGCHYCEFTQ